MTKLYYNDPIKAAWMCREFGVCYTDESIASINAAEDQPRILFDRSARVLEKFRIVMVYPPKCQYHIHPDSLPIFEPYDTDEAPGGWWFNANLCAWVRTSSDTCHDGKPCFEMRQPHEIQTAWRDGKAFFMPERD